MGIGKSKIKLPSELEREYVGSGDFEEIGIHLVELFKKFGRLSNSNDILDVGCGIGRVAIPLANYLNENSRYEGFDLVKSGIDWCKINITPHYPNFNFTHANITNSRYNPTGKIKARKFNFPYHDNSFDFVFLTSVFTHMLQYDLENYLFEINRVLRPEGIIFSTFFLINDDSLNGIKNGKSAFKFPYKKGNCYLEYPTIPEAVVGYDEQFIISTITKYGFGIPSIHKGSWCGREMAETGHDFVVSKKINKPTNLIALKRSLLNLIP